MNETLTMWKIVICAVGFGVIIGYVWRECRKTRWTVRKRLEAIQKLVPSDSEILAELDPALADYVCNQMQPTLGHAELALHAIETRRVPPKIQALSVRTPSEEPTAKVIT